MRISEKFFDTEFCTPSLPTFFGGNKSQCASKSSPKLGDLGGLYVANGTSQTTSNTKSGYYRVVT